MVAILDMNTGVFRGGCLTGPNHSGAKLHGFLAYLMKCTITGDHYTIFGYKGKQVTRQYPFFRFGEYVLALSIKIQVQGEVYNAGGGRFANCSMLEGYRNLPKNSTRQKD